MYVHNLYLAYFLKTEKLRGNCRPRFKTVALGQKSNAFTCANINLMEMSKKEKGLYAHPRSAIYTFATKKWNCHVTREISIFFDDVVVVFAFPN